MPNWKNIKKIDAHIHILPDAVHAANTYSDDPFLQTNLQQYAAMMDDLGIEKAIIMPFNDPFLMSMEFTVDAVHRNLAEMKQRYPGKFYAFADIDPRRTPAESLAAIRKAIEEYRLDGIKLHPNNAGITLDSDFFHPILAYAQDRRIPVAIHSYPNTPEDPGAASRVLRILDRFPELTVIISHMGGHQWEQLVPTKAFVDLSAILPDYVRT